jgi:hypothetical protein
MIDCDHIGKGLSQSAQRQRGPAVVSAVRFLMSQYTYLAQRLTAAGGFIKGAEPVSAIEGFTCVLTLKVVMPVLYDFPMQHKRSTVKP